MTAKIREHWVDLLKGVCALFVMLAHTADTPIIYRVFYAYFMLPSFFFVSGYLTKDEKITDYMYKRILKLLILYFVYSYLTFFLSIDTVSLIIRSPGEFNRAFVLKCIEIFTGQGLWFIAGLIVVSLIFALIKAIAKKNTAVMLAVSITVALAGLLFCSEGRIFWNINTALVCQVFFVFGFVAKENGLLNKITHIKSVCAISGLLYLMLIYGAYFLLGEEAVAIVVGTNTWKFLPVTIPALILGNLFVITLSKQIGKVPIINYIGKHALLYYALGSRGLSIASKLFSIFGIDNRYILNLLIVLVAALIMLIPCLIIDKFFPFLNGNFKLPELKSNNQ